MTRQDLDIAYFRGRLEEMRESLTNQIQQLEQDYDPSIANPNQGYGVNNHPADDATDVFDRQRYRAIGSDLEEELRSVEQALERIDNGTYGICAVSGKPIPVERLEARPAAATLVEYQDEYDRQVRGS